MKRKEFLSGLKSGIPICVGYLSVSFGFGAMAVAQGLSIFQAILISATNLTSAGQFTGLTVIATGATILEMILTQLVINSRYSLMSLALGQRFGQRVGVLTRIPAAFFNTDEVFAMGMAQGKALTTSFYFGVGIISAIGWVSGTALGACAGALLPEDIRAALSVMLYGMFIAIVVPQARAEKSIFVCVCLALVFSCLFTWVPQLSSISTGLAIVICTVVAAAISAILFPVDEEDKQ